MKLNFKYFSNENIQLNAIEKIRDNRQIDGFIVKQFLDANEIKDWLLKANSNKEMFSKVKEGMETWPMPMGINTLDNFIDDYEKTNTFWKSINFNAEKKIFSFFEKLHYIVSTLSSDNKNATVGSFRKLNLEKKNVLNIHVGNAFFKRFNGFYTKFGDDILFQNQLSYFILLNKPDNGGQLELFDMYWANCEEVINKSEYFKLTDGTLMHYKAVASQKLNMEPGDLLVFAGGQIYHQVTSHEGGDRITFGGFIGFDKSNKQKLYLWT